MSAGFVRELWRSTIDRPTSSSHACPPLCAVCAIKRDLLAELAVGGSFTIEPGPGDEPPRVSNPAYRAIAEMVVEGLIRDDIGARGATTLVITRKGIEAASA